MKLKGRILLFLILPILWLMLFINVALCQQPSLTESSVSTLSDGERLYQCIVEVPLLKQEIELYKQREELHRQEIAIKDQFIELEKKRAELYKEAFENEKQLTDRALKLAEQNKSKGFWEVLGGVAVIAIIVTVIASVL